LPSFFCSVLLECLVYKCLVHPKKERRKKGHCSLYNGVEVFYTNFCFYINTHTVKLNTS